MKVYGNNEHGGHAKYLKVPANTLVPLREELTFTAGAAIACGSGTAYGALRRMNVSGRDTIAIFGQGPVGLAGTQFAEAIGRPRDRPGHQPTRGCNAPRNSARMRLSIRARTIRSRRSRI